MIRALLANWLGAFRDALTLARALPWLIGAMIAIELVQHAVELHLGYFSGDPALHRQAGESALRMAFGWPKMLILYAVGFLAVRWLATHDTGRALRPDARALQRYAGVVLFQLIPAALIIYAPQIVAALDLADTAVLPFRATFGLAQQVIEPLLYLWFVNAALGTDGFGPVASAKTTRWLYFWALVLVLAVRLPLSQLHGRLNLWSAGQPLATQWALLTLDALVVGVLAVAVPAVQLRIARFVADRRGVPLLGGEGGAASANVGYKLEMPS